MKKYLYLLLFLPAVLWGQKTKKAQQTKDKALVALRAGDIELANSLLNTAAENYEKLEQWKSYIDCGLLLSSNLMEIKNYSLALQTANKFVTKALEKKQTTISLSLLYKNIGKIHYQQYNDKASLKALQKALNIREKLKPKDPELAKDYSNLAVLSRYANRYNQAIVYLEKAIKLQKEEIVLAKIYTEIATNYKLIGNFRKSLDYINQAITFLETTKDRKALAVALFEKGAILTTLKQNGRDRKYLFSALNIFESYSINDKENQVICYRQLANSYYQFAIGGYESKNGLDSAIIYYKKALGIAQKYVQNNSLEQVKITMELANVYANKQKIVVASGYLKEVESIGINLLDSKSIVVANFYTTKSEIALLKKNYTEAIAFSHESLLATLPNYSDTNPYKNPSLAILSKSISNDIVTDCLARKARVLTQAYKQTQNQKYLTMALQTVELFDEMIDYIRVDFANSGTNIAWSDLTLDAYENALEICLALAQKTGKESYKEKAFYFSEKSKGLSLLEAFQNTKAQKIAGVDMVAELKLKLDISDIEQTVFQLEQQNKLANSTKIKALKQTLFVKKERYATMIADLEKNHKAYFNAKYKMEVLEVAAVRQMLQEDQALIEYFVGDSAIYIFKISQNNFEMLAVKGQQNMGEQVHDFREGIYSYFLNERDRNPQMLARYAEQYTTKAYELYQALVKPLGKLPHRLIIVPAGAICDMPFESLLTQKETAHTQFDKHSYFVKDKIISYAYSATLLQEMQTQNHRATPYTYLGFAPSFGKGSESIIRGKRYSLSPLAYNKVEVENIQKLLGQGDIYNGAAATESQFKALASQYSIIHFATHGLANSQDPDYSLLAFTEIKDSIENEFLYVKDMYNISLNADMVVLSACETALGKNFRGEGIMSIARGFSYAGAKSIFTTLWSVNDQATYQIVELFYRNLQKGMPKDEALQQAKITFITEGTVMTAHPFLWSPYIMIGDMSPLDSIQEDTYPWIWIVSGLLAVMLLLGYWWYTKPKK